MRWHAVRRVYRAVRAAARTRLRGDPTAADGGESPRSIPDGGVTIEDRTDTAAADREQSAVSTAADHDGRTAETADNDAGGVGSSATTADGGDATTIQPVDDDSPAAVADVDQATLLNSLDRPAFILTADGELSAANTPLARLAGVDDPEPLDAAAVGELLTEEAAETTLAEKVLASPTNADADVGVTLADRDRLLYRETGTAVGDGESYHIETTARPLFDGETVAAVIQIITDRTADHRRQQATEELVASLESALSGLAAGNLGVRAEPPGDAAALDDDLEALVGALNDAVTQLESMAGGIERQTRQLDDYITAADAAADEIATNVTEQSELLEESVDEMQSFSASMEEVASTAEEVDTAAEEARDAAENGLEASEGAKDATDEVVEIGDELVEQVTALGEQMDDIEAVVEVINDIAEQTNILALNANIEAARAGEEGDGFAVVAEEVKNLADETQTHTEEITDSINRLHEQTDETVASATESHERIDHASEQIADVLDAFEEIADSIDQAANGIAEVSRATDEQAATVEELTATLETVRDRSGDTEAATEDIIEATDEQRAALEDLTRQLRQLQGS